MAKPNNPVPNASVDSHRALTALVVAIIVYGSTLFAVTLVHEWSFFAAHTAQKTRLLRLPDEIERTQAAIRDEQAALVKVQKEITERLSQK